MSNIVNSIETPPLQPEIPSTHPVDINDVVLLPSITSETTEDSSQEGKDNATNAPVEIMMLLLVDRHRHVRP